MAQHSTNGPERDSAETTARLLAIVKDLALELHPSRTAAESVTLDSSLDRELGFDSLGLVELLVRLERAFDITLPEALFGAGETPRDLLRAVLVAGGRAAHTPAGDVGGISLGRTEALPRAAHTLVEVLDWHAETHPERPHIQFYQDDGRGGVITYGALREGAGRVAAGLQRRGLQAGETVAIMLPTGADYFRCFFGILLAGGIPVAIYPPGRIGQIEEHLRRHAAILNNALARTLITVPEAARFSRLLKAQVETLRHVVTPEDLSTAEPPAQLPAVGGADIAFIQYTSGSTGDPKGVVLTHDNLLANIRVMGEALDVESTDVFISWLPLYHDMGLIAAWFGSLYFSTLLVIMSPLTFLARPERWLWAVHRHHGTISSAPNFAYELCARRIEDKDIEGLDLSSWRAASNGAEAVSPETLRRFGERFSPYGFRPQALMPTYGLAECTVGLAIPPLDRGPLIDRVRREPFMRSGEAIPAADSDDKALRHVSCGFPLSGHEIRIVNRADRELPERREGRLQFKGPSATSGYFRSPENTRRLFHGDWLDSGDIAYIARGEVYITGRAKDLIIRAGRNIYPDEFEAAVGNIEGILKGNVAVFGSLAPDLATERLIVLAETRRTKPEVLEEIHHRINALSVDLIETPPDDIVLAPPRTVLKTSSGKIRRAACKEIYERGLIGKPPTSVRWQLIHLALDTVVPQFHRLRRGVSETLYAAYAWFLAGLAAPVLWLTATFVPGAWLRRGIVRAVLWSVAWGLRIPVSVRGLENLPPRGQPCVLVSNHASYVDSFVLVAALPSDFGFVAKAELADRFITRIPLRRLGTEFVERFEKTKGVEDTQRIARVVGKGRPLLFFVEGTLSRMPGLLPFHMGAFTVAAEVRVPVIPITIRGTRSILRGMSWFPRRTAVSIVIEEPIDTKAVWDQSKGDTWAVAVALRDKARECILKHSGEPNLDHETIDMPRPDLSSGGSGNAAS